MLEVFEIYQPPQADRNKIAGKMLGHILITADTVNDFKHNTSPRNSI